MKPLLCRLGLHAWDDGWWFYMTSNWGKHLHFAKWVVSCRRCRAEKKNV